MNRAASHTILTLAALLLFFTASAQQVLTLEDCRDMAVSSNRELRSEKTKVEMAGYDRKIALAYFFPSITATGAYVWNDRNIDLISDEKSDKLRHAGDKLKAAIEDRFGTPAVVLEEIVAAIEGIDIASAINQIGCSIDDEFHFNVKNALGVVISARQPIFMGGKILYSNEAARLAEELALSSYDMKYVSVLAEVDGAYWQIVTIAAKKRLAENYADLLEQMEVDVEKSMEAGLSTKSDVLQVKVKASEARLLLTKATNGLRLAKMLLCQKTGLPLDSEILLADEIVEDIPIAVPGPEKDIEQVYEDRPETKSLDLASKIYDKKVAIAAADMMPQIALMANYLATNPSFNNGFEQRWGGRFSVGVVINVPIFHGTEALQKTRKAKAEASLYRDRLDDARDMINLQVTRQRKLCEEAIERLEMTRDGLESAEENMRVAASGFEAGVIDTNTALAAQTAWLQAHSEYIDAAVGLQIAVADLERAEGNVHP